MAHNDVHVAMMNLLWPRTGLPRQFFYDYWSGAHTQISSRLPGIHQYFEHHLDAESGMLFPGAEKFVEGSRPHPGFFGDAEITFMTADDLAAFAAALAPLMDDEQNVFDKTISYQAKGENARTLVDRSLDDSPNGDLGDVEKYMLYLRRSGDVAEFRTAIVEIAAELAESDDIVKVRYRFPEYYDNDAVTLLAPNVSNYEHADDQVHASLEVVFTDALARRRFGATELSSRLTALISSICSDVYPTRVLRTFTVYNHGRITLAGLRTPQMAAQITAIGAINQVNEQTEQLMLREHTFRARSGS